MVRNIADHSDSNGQIELQYILDTSQQKTYLHFCVLDEGKGIPFNKQDSSEIVLSADILPWEKK
jgi:anti-sigma regulatory factor (Ser/Thr protein kinase)